LAQAIAPYPLRQIGEELRDVVIGYHTGQPDRRLAASVLPQGVCTSTTQKPDHGAVSPRVKHSPEQWGVSVDVGAINVCAMVKEHASDLYGSLLSCEMQRSESVPVGCVRVVAGDESRLYQREIIRERRVVELGPTCGVHGGSIVTASKVRMLACHGAEAIL